jgi:NTE family protein
MLGGLFKMTGLADSQLVGQNALNGSLLYYRKLGGSLYAGCAVETGGVWNDRSEAELGDMLWGGTVYAALDTILGPIYFAYGYTEGEGSGRLRFSLGKNF